MWFNGFGFRRAARRQRAAVRDDARPEPRKGWPLAWHLAALCAVVLAPMLALEAALLFHLAHGERARHEATAREAARRITVNLNRELIAMRTLMEVLATSDHLKAGDIGAFISRAEAVPRPAGAEIVLQDRAGHLLASTARPAERRRALAGLAPAAPDQAGIAAPFSGLLAAPSGQRAFAVSTLAPAASAAPTYRLSLEVPLAFLDDLVRDAEIPAGMVASLLDGAGFILARSQDAARLVGTRVPPELEMPLAEAQGWRHGRSAAGEEVVVAFSRSGLSGWTVTVFMPETAFAAPLRLSFWTMLAIGLLLAALVAAMASLFARRIARPIAALAGFAAAGGEPAAFRPHGKVQEVEAVAAALAAVRAESTARLREREDLLITLDSAQVVVREPEGRILVWTSGSEHLYGWTPAEALGRISHELLETQFPCPLERIMAALLARGEWQGELRQRRRDGSVVTVISQWALRRGPDGAPHTVVEASNDITGLREAEAALRLNRDLLASVLDASAEPISARDLEGRLVILNQPSAAVYGTTVEGAIGRRVEELLPPAAAAAARAADLAVITSGRTQVLENEIPAGDGSLRVLLSSKAPWRDGAGRTVGVVTVSRDITVRRRAQARLQQMQEELLHVSRLSAMGALAAELAHELNQPLTAVANFADAARRMLGSGGTPDAAQLHAAREAMTEAAEQAVHAGRIIRRLRDFIGRGEAERQPTPLNMLVEEAVRLAMAGAGKQGVVLRLELAPDAPEVLADRVRIQQVVFNLVRNALDAMQEVPHRELRIGTARAGASAVLTVADTGPGLSKAVAEHIFEPFISTKPEGMGIGLSICRSIVEDHGGRLAAEATPGGGATFRVTLPAVPQHAVGGAEVTHG
ncbi:PAS domain-containing protein [Roseomonas sp. E05]|uniref:ATP-binding protein n=1 Tax=Roseomonas sp. E05 TaxID=3046310 RepID=UPI0024BBE305|nr:ATP-binding protein [Roseomonas sp. E05]MDJ0389339.1 PAS domain-containing protein [Roseomonas sp. E05]